MKAGLVALLTGESTISAIVGSRVYVKTPQNPTRPYILLTKMGKDPNKMVDGTGPMRNIDFDIDCKAETATQAEALAKAVSAFLEDYTGPAGSDVVKASLWNDESDDDEPPTDGSQTVTHVVTLDFTFQYVPG